MPTSTRKKFSYFLYSLLAAFLGYFLLWPVVSLLAKASSFDLLFGNLLFLESLSNSFLIAAATTSATFAVSLPVASMLGRYRFAGKKAAQWLLWLPLLAPPFVGAIGVRQLFSRHGAVNMALLEGGWIGEPVDWLGGGGAWAIVALQTLHLFPILVSQLQSSFEGMDPRAEEAARNCGARGFFLLRTVRLPLLAPGIFSGCSLVFLWSFTDLGTPLMLDFAPVVSVQIFNLVSEASVNPVGFGMAAVTALFCLALFWAVRGAGGGRGKTASVRRGAEEGRPEPGAGKLFLFYAGAAALLAAALLPHVGVFLVAFSKNWLMTPLPQEWTFEHFEKIFRHPLTLESIRNSFYYSFASAFLDLGLGLAAAYILVRGQAGGRGLLDLVVMLPMVLPGLVLAFSYLVTFSGGPLDPRENPVLLLVVAYAIRRLPFVVRSCASGLEQVAGAFEEAAKNCGAPPARVLATVTLPLMRPHLIAAFILAFSLAMLEVSDSLILAFEQRFYPITKAIYQVMGRMVDGAALACALGVLGILILFTGLFFASESLRKTFS